MGRARGHEQLSARTGHRRTVPADAYEGFTFVFGDRRGSGLSSETDLSEAELVPASERPEIDPIFQALTAAVTYTTAEGDKALSDPGLRYLAVARSQHNDELHIVGGGAEIADALRAFDQEEDFTPMVVVDIDSADLNRCAHKTYRTGSRGYQASPLGSWSMNDIVPGTVRT